MPTNRSNISLNRTLIILLGIILACLLTLNAKSFYSAETLSFPEKRVKTLDNNASVELLEGISKSTLRSFIEKVSLR